jgi:hypothetical protein
VSYAFRLFVRAALLRLAFFKALLGVFFRTGAAFRAAAFLTGNTLALLATLFF